MGPPRARFLGCRTSSRPICCWTAPGASSWRILGWRGCWAPPRAAPTATKWPPGTGFWGVPVPGMSGCPPKSRGPPLTPLLQVVPSPRAALRRPALRRGRGFVVSARFWGVLPGFWGGPPGILGSFPGFWGPHSPILQRCLILGSPFGFCRSPLFLLAVIPDLPLVPGCVPLGFWGGPPGFLGVLPGFGGLFCLMLGVLHFWVSLLDLWVPPKHQGLPQIWRILWDLGHPSEILGAPEIRGVPLGFWGSPSWILGVSLGFGDPLGFEESFWDSGGPSGILGIPCDLGVSSGILGIPWDSGGLSGILGVPLGFWGPPDPRSPGLWAVFSGSC